MEEFDWAKDQLNELLNNSIDIALKLINKHGSHIPFATVIDRKGERLNIATDDSEGTDVEILTKTLLDELKIRCRKAELCAVAFTQNVDYTSAEDGTKVDAIEISLDHNNSDALTCYLPYSIDGDGIASPRELISVEPKYKFFKPIIL